ncbi:epidermal growth factor receptor kinase substrate 8-like protein 3 isoform X1 [Misgurnus anguillicaudatus]|uniref:epidermal growth factor receptor kinase substrate 8-like protein 3 isoform X1 n=1 Tax=Misgurnus anguillicaudatus TaxID=75329 RepID=UPI003CCF370B
MFESSSQYDWSNSYADSVQSASTAVDETSSELSRLSRPSAKSIYLQRKDYVESINREMHRFCYKVEHLFTCELDGQQLSSVQDCVERLSFLESTGRVWGQDVILEGRDQTLQLIDIDTKEELESWSLSSILDVSAVLDECVYESLLTLSVQNQKSRIISVFLFQTESLRADYMKKDLERFLQRKTREQKQNNISKAAPGNFGQRNVRSSSPLTLNTQKLPEHWSAPDYDETPVQSPPPLKLSPPPQRPYTERQRDVDILNHLINDIEAFVDRVTAVAPKMDKKKKKKKKKKKVVKGMPTEDEFTMCLRKVKMAFNLLAKLQGKIENPNAVELIHCLFTVLPLIVFNCSEDLPQSVVVPLLEPMCIQFLSEHATTEEDQLWQSLGDPWNIPSTKWADDDEFVQTFTPVFDDGWTPPDIRQPRITDTPRTPVTPQMSFRSRLETTQSAEDETPVSFLRATFDFTARNDRELTVSKGEELQLLDMSKQWWKVRNHEGRVGYVPNNMLQSPDQQKTQESAQASAPALSTRSRPEEVRVWLEHKGFSRITIRCLGGLSGSMLLGMTRDELKTVCPEEGGRVFYQLQNVKSALAMATAVTPMM